MKLWLLIYNLITIAIPFIVVSTISDHMFCTVQLKKQNSLAFNHYKLLHSIKFFLIFSDRTVYVMAFFMPVMPSLQW